MGHRSPERAALGHPGHHARRLLGAHPDGARGRRIRATSGFSRPSRRRPGVACSSTRRSTCAGEPIVCTPEDAYRCFMRTEMDLLVLENCVLDKVDQKPLADDARLEARVRARLRLRRAAATARATARGAPQLRPDRGRDLRGHRSLAAGRARRGAPAGGRWRSASCCSGPRSWRRGSWGPSTVLWMGLAEVLGWINTRILSRVVFFGVVTPMGVVMRLLAGSDAPGCNPTAYVSGPARPDRRPTCCGSSERRRGWASSRWSCGRS